MHYTETVDIADPKVDVVGMDFILHNMYAEKDYTIRKWFRDDADAMLQRVASHVQQKLYSIISIQLSKHSCVVVCASDVMAEDWPEGSLIG